MKTFCKISKFQVPVFVSILVSIYLGSDFDRGEGVVFNPTHKSNAHKKGHEV